VDVVHVEDYSSISRSPSEEKSQEYLVVSRKAYALGSA